jgi:hypothetical protein
VKNQARALPIVALALVGCDGADPLAVIDNPSNSAEFVDAVIGDSTRIICVSPGKQFCSRWNADVVATGLQRYEDFRAGWNGDDEVIVTIKGGVVERSNATAASGTIRIKVVRLHD